MLPIDLIGFARVINGTRGTLNFRAQRELPNLVNTCGNPGWASFMAYLASNPAALLKSQGPWGFLPVLISPSPSLPSPLDWWCEHYRRFPVSRSTYSTSRTVKMVHWRDPMEIARDSGIWWFSISKSILLTFRSDVFLKLIYALFGVYVWELFITCDFEWTLITRRRKFHWPLVCFIMLHV